METKTVCADCAAKDNRIALLERALDDAKWDRESLRKIFDQHMKYCEAVSKTIRKAAEAAAKPPAECMSSRYWAGPPGSLAHIQPGQMTKQDFEDLRKQRQADGQPPECLFCPTGNAGGWTWMCNSCWNRFEDRYQELHG